MNELSKLNPKIEKDLRNYYKNMLSIDSKSNFIEIKLPVFLDDSTQCSLFISKKAEGKTVISSSLYYSLENSIYEKINTRKNILTEYLLNPKEFESLKTSLINIGINSNSTALEYDVKDLKNIYKEIILYVEITKSFYNNIYHLLINRLSKTHERYNIFYKNFSNIMISVKEKIKLSEYSENKISTSPIYINDFIIISAGKDLDGLAKLYIDTTRLINNNTKDKKGIIFIEGEHSDNTKMETLYNDFEKIGFKIKELKTNELLEKNIIENIESEMNVE